MANGTTRDRTIRLEEKVSDLQGDLTEVKGDVKEILVNHLPHLAAKIEKVAWQVGLGVGLLAMAGSAIGGELVKFFLK